MMNSLRRMTHPSTTSLTFIPASTFILSTSTKVCRNYRTLTQTPSTCQISHDDTYPPPPRRRRTFSPRTETNNKTETPLSSSLPSRLSLPLDEGGIRINKCFKSFASRRQSDFFVQEGRVTLNGKIALPGTRVHTGDTVELDGSVVDWERLTIDVNTEDFVYIKHWKAIDIICTTDTSIPENIIDHIKSTFVPSTSDRIFPIGRLDQSSSGCILLTSDGRLPNAVLGAGSDCEKSYLVTPDMYVTNEDLWKLQQGVVITTISQRDRNVKKPRISKTLPCQVERSGSRIIITLKEGRNRQIRKMLGALGYTTRDIHRIGFMGITLDGLSQPGDSCYLNEEEMKLVNAKLEASSQSDIKVDPDLD